MDSGFVQQLRETTIKVRQGMAATPSNLNYAEEDRIAEDRAHECLEKAKEKAQKASADGKNSAVAIEFDDTQTITAMRAKNNWKIVPEALKPWLRKLYEHLVAVPFKVEIREYRKYSENWDGYQMIISW